MNILVYDIAAEFAGALTILENFYKEVCDYPDKRIKWIFIVSADVLCSHDNIEVMSVPETKKSWLHRIYFERKLLPRIIAEKKITLFFSMQNMALKWIHVKQIVYLHQSLQFSPVKFSFLDAAQRQYAIRQTFVCNIYKKSLKYADHIIVQSKWMKEATARWINVEPDRISVLTPKVIMDAEYNYNRQDELNNIFFYPAGEGPHKNHILIIEACRLLKESGIENYKVIFTMQRNQSAYTCNIAQICEEGGLPVEFIGIVPKERVYELYRDAIVLFPSYLETYGLPLQEAALMGDLILASDQPFSHEVLDGYTNAYFYDIHDSEKLALLMKDILNGDIVRQDTSYKMENRDTLVGCLLQWE